MRTPQILFRRKARQWASSERRSPRKGGRTRDEEALVHGVPGDGVHILAVAEEALELAVHAQLEQAARRVLAARYEPVAIPVEAHRVDLVLVAMVRRHLRTCPRVPQPYLHAAALGRALTTERQRVKWGGRAAHLGVAAARSE